MSEIKIDAFRYTLSLIDDGWLFESFAQSFLSAVLSYEFIPVGGTKDKGIDGLGHVFYRKGYKKQIFQISTEKDHEGKIKRSIETLRTNDIKFDVFTYVTNRSIKNKDALIDKLFDAYSINVRIFDLAWFTANVNFSQGTRNAYFTYINSNLQEFNKPGKSFVVSNVDTDSRIFVFLRQQLESKAFDFKIDDLLADSLILFALEGTDPDTEIFKTKDEIKELIRIYVQFDPKLLDDTINRRLEELSKKPRKIKYHTENKNYCLPYETRMEITQRNLSDNEMQRLFYEQTAEIIKKYLKEKDASIKDLTKLIDEVIHKIFYQQGLEFSNFVLHGDSQKSVDKDLQETINLVVDESNVIEKNKEIVKTCLQIAIREIVYTGTPEQRRYLKSLSNTYMMMFLLQWNPQVALYFETMSSRLNVYVCTSILIPAFSEYYLDEQNKRHWNLLKAAQLVGIRLFITDAIVDELVSHFRMIKSRYDNLFAFTEAIYLSSDIETLYIDEVLIRAYFHAKSRGLSNSFDDFLNNFCDPSVWNVKEELIDYLQNQFGILYQSDASLKMNLPKDDLDKLSQKLMKQGKKHVKKAQTDAKTILAIYKLRERNNETSDSGIYGYRTWWLSKDTSTYRAVISVFKNKYPVSCYMRPDFLYNHIALAPKKIEVDSMYKEIFPSLLGVNLSFHLPKEVTDYVQKVIAEHSAKDPARVKAIIRQLSEKLKSDPAYRDVNTVKLFLDEELIKHTMKG
jgi:hypothetical protein